ncbi:MAG: type II toxin-antitoxin system Phd/YefM family antitoxin [Pseudonocardiales bacterium]
MRAFTQSRYASARHGPGVRANSPSPSTPRWRSLASDGQPPPAEQLGAYLAGTPVAQTLVAHVARRRAIMEAMTVIPVDQRPLTDVLAELERSQGRLDIARDGHTVATLVSAEYLESLEETIAVATDPELVAAVAEGRAELDAGQGIPAHEVEAEFLNRS